MTRLVLICLALSLSGCATVLADLQTCTRDLSGDLKVGALGASFKGKAKYHCEPTKPPDPPVPG